MRNGPKDKVEAPAHVPGRDLVLERVRPEFVRNGPVALLLRLGQNHLVLGARHLRLTRAEARERLKRDHHARVDLRIQRLEHPEDVNQINQ